MGGTWGEEESRGERNRGEKEKDRAEGEGNEDMGIVCDAHG